MPSNGYVGEVDDLTRIEGVGLGIAYGLITGIVPWMPSHDDGLIVIQDDSSHEQDGI